MAFTVVQPFYPKPSPPLTNVMSSSFTPLSPQAYTVSTSNRIHFLRCSPRPIPPLHPLLFLGPQPPPSYPFQTILPIHTSTCTARIIAMCSSFFFLFSFSISLPVYILPFAFSQPLSIYVQRPFLIIDSLPPSLTTVPALEK